MQLAPIRSARFQGQDVTPLLAELDNVAEPMLDDLLWWTRALKTARAGVTAPE